jgi:hypothetical protein
MTKRQANEITGGLSSTGKMPCASYGLPAAECHIGSELREVAGSTCENCYALKGNYTRFRGVIPAEYRRLGTLSHPDWVAAMVYLIKNDNFDYAKQLTKFFRWHDAGDVQSVMHLRNIVLVCQQTPEISHWLPCREYKVVTDCRKMYGEFPSNLTVRLSAHMVDGSAPTGYGLPTSGVHSSESVEPADAKICGSYQNDGMCGTCRACWSRDVAHVSYLRH